MDRTPNNGNAEIETIVVDESSDDDSIFDIPIPNLKNMQKISPTTNGQSSSAPIIINSTQESSNEMDNSVTENIHNMNANNNLFSDYNNVNSLDLPKFIILIDKVFGTERIKQIDKELTSFPIPQKDELEIMDDLKYENFELKVLLNFIKKCFGYSSIQDILSAIVDEIVECAGIVLRNHILSKSGV